MRSMGIGQSYNERRHQPQSWVYKNNSGLPVNGRYTQTIIIFLTNEQIVTKIVDVLQCLGQVPFILSYHIDIYHYYSVIFVQI